MKKSKKGEVGSLFDSIKQTPAPIQDPLKSEKFYSADGERMTRITYRLNPKPVEVSADKLMEGAQIYLGFLISRDPWHSILPWLESPEGVIKKFWECYKREEAETGRKIAIDGSKSCNRTNERNLLNAAHEYKALSLQKYGLELGKDACLQFSQMQDYQKEIVRQRWPSWRRRWWIGFLRRSGMIQRHPNGYMSF